MREEVERVIHARDRLALRDILSAPRNERIKRFWKHVNRAEPKTGRRSKIRSGDGELVNKSSMPQQLTELASEILDSTQISEQAEPPVRLTEPSGITKNCEKMKSVLSGVKSNSSTGLDDGIRDCESAERARLL